MNRLAIDCAVGLTGRFVYARRMRERLEPWGFIGIGAIACELFLYGASVIFAPWWLVTLLVLVWIALLGTALRWFNPRPKATIGLAVLGVAIWVGAVALAAAVK